jgi:PAS domain S-box-containing protein
MPPHMKNQEQGVRLDGQLFYDAFRASPIGVALEGLDGRPLFVNPALCSMLGFSEEELLSKHCVDFSPAEDAEKDWALFRQLQAGSINHYSLDKRYFRRDGSLVWGRLSISLLRDSNSTSPMVLAMVEDITEKKMAEEGLIQAQHDLEVVTKEMAAAVARCSSDLQYLWANQGYADLVQRPLHEIVGHPILEVLGAETFEAVRPYFERVLAGETVNYEREVNYKGAGREWISATFTPTLAASGGVDGWVAVIVDITGRKLAEEAIRESEKRYRRIVETTNEGVWLLNASLYNSYVNRQMAEMLGYEPNEMIGRSVFDFYFSEDVELKKQVLERRQQGWREQIEERLRRKDGSELWARISAVPLFKENGEFDGSLAMVEDITERLRGERERKQAEEALSKVSQKLIQAQEDERSRLARELHDDINQRLSLLAVTLDGLKKELPAAADQLRQHLSAASAQVADIGKDIQALSHRLHSPKLELLGLAAAASSFCKEFSRRQNVEIDFQSENVVRNLPDNISLTLYRILQEALQNAVKHSGSRHFRVSLVGGTNEIELTVQDSGFGFEPDEAVKGSGLGLASMKERMKLVDGELSIDSQLQHGTTIRARVPFHPKRKAAGAV